MMKERLLSCLFCKTCNLQNLHRELCKHEHLQAWDLPRVNQGSWVFSGYGIIHHLVNHRVDRVKHTFITWETNSVEKNNINKTFSIGLSNITSLLLHFFMFLDKVKVERGKKKSQRISFL